jgi:predicted phosphodiesterase
MTDKKDSDRVLLQFAVITDTHIRPPDTIEEGGYVSNQCTIDRVNYVVKCLNGLQPDFVIHLGDVVHPIPLLHNHEDAVKKALEIFSEIEADFYVVPGNHDIGDKPNAWLPAPIVEEDSHLDFVKHWGPAYQSFSAANCLFICLDTLIMNSGFDRERTQRNWLENELRIAKEKNLRLFIFMHYPLFICDSKEPTHYDNIDQPARNWLLELLVQYRVEAVFSGHVHNVFISIHEDTLLYSLPSTTFVRPEYSELATVAPGDEFGRDDTAKLGFFLVKVYSDRHEILPVRTFNAGKLDQGSSQFEPSKMIGEISHMLGVTLRREWGRRVELAADGLDEFNRKEAYRDGLLLALLELGVTALRVPFADLTNEGVRGRMADFSKLGFEFTVFSLGAPDEGVLDTIETFGNLIASWELIFPEHLLSQIKDAILKAQLVFSGQLFIAPVVPIKEVDRDSKTFQHFASHGFSCHHVEQIKNWLSMIPKKADDIGLTYRVSPWDDPASTLREIDQQFNHEKLINLQLPRLDEGVCFDDDDKLLSFIVEAYQASRKMACTTVFIDTFIDSDRGYYPRIGLLDRRFNPRPAFYALKQAALQMQSFQQQSNCGAI